MVVKRVAATMAAGLLLVVAWPALQGRVQSYDDLLLAQLPFRMSYAENLRGGLPLGWCRYLFCGFDLAGEGQLGAFHPAHLLLYRLLPFSAAFELDLLWPYPVLLLGTFLWWRRHLPDGAAAAGALWFAFTGFHTLHFHHPALLAAAAHLPWLLFALDGLLDADTPRQAASWRAWLALVTASQGLLGHPQAIWMTVLAEVWYLAARLSLVPARWRRLGDVAGAHAVGWLLAAPQALAVGGYYLDSARREADAAFRNTFAVWPGGLLQALAPYAYAGRRTGQIGFNETAVYAGCVPVMLAVCGVAVRPRSASLRRLRAMAWLGAAVAGLLCLGDRGGLGRVLAWLPVVGGFRCPGRYGLLLQLGLGAAAAITLAGLLDSAADGERPAVWRPALACWGLSVLAALWYLPHALRGEPRCGRVAELALGPLLFGLAGWLVCATARGKRLAAAGLVVLAAVDLGAYGLQTPVHRQSRAPSELSGLVTAPAEPERGRLLGTDNRAALAGYSTMDGYTGFPPSRRLHYADPATWRVANVRFARAAWRGGELDCRPKTLLDWLAQVHEGDAATMEQAVRDGLRRSAGRNERDDGWLELPGALGRAWLCGQAVVSQRPADDLPKLDPRTTCLADEPVSLGGGDGGEVRTVRDESGVMAFMVDAPVRQMLVVSESYHTGWHATVDGGPEAVRRVDGDFLGCVVPPGRHEVRFEFRSPALGPGRWLSAAGLLLWAVWTGLGLGARAGGPDRE